MEVPAEEPAPQPERRKGQQRRKTAQQPPQEPPRRELVKVRFTLKGIGEIPSMYRWVRYGKGVLALGMDPDTSYTPPVTESNDDPRTMEVNAAPGRLFANLGLSFNAPDGTPVLVLVELPKEPDRDYGDESGQYDKEDDNGDEQDFQ